MSSDVGPFFFFRLVVRAVSFGIPVPRSESTMTVTVLLFASYADALGANQLSLDLPVGATVGDIVTRVQQMPGAARLPKNPLVAVNERYAKRDRAISAGDEVALIPPVAGG
jgi:molybdopterin converting factor subunit 1